jgi:phage terminase large subunit-like protein
VSLSALAAAAHVLGQRAHADPLAYYRPTPPQLRFLQSTSQIKLFRAGNQAGKTWAGVADCIWRCLGAHPHTLVKSAPIEAWVVVVSWEQSLSIQGKIWQLLPKDQIEGDCEYTPGKGFRGKVPIVRFKNGSILRIRTVNQGALALAGATIDYVLIDEPPPEAIWSELAARVLRQRGRIAITLTPIGLPLGWLRALVESGEVEDIHTPLTVEATTPIGGRPLLRADDIAKLEAQVLPMERAQRIHGEWEAGFTEGRVFVQFDHTTMVRDEAPTGEAQIAIGIDHGKESGAQTAVMVAVTRSRDNEPRITVLDVVSSNGMTTPEDDAAQILSMIKRAGLRWEQIDRWVGDRAAVSRRGGALKSNALLVQAFEKSLKIPIGTWPARIHTAYKPAGSVFHGYRVLQAAMLRGDFVIHPRCKRLIDDLGKFDGRAASEHKHTIDGLRYALELVTRRQYQPQLLRIG